MKRRKNQLDERRNPLLNRFQVFWRGIHDYIVIRRVAAVAERPIDQADSIPLGDIYRFLEISFSWLVRERVKTRVSHDMISLEEGEWVLCFYHSQHYFKTELRQQRLNVNVVESSPPFLIEVTAKDSHKVDEKAVDYGARNVTQGNSVLFGKR